MLRVGTLRSSKARSHCKDQILAAPLMVATVAAERILAAVVRENAGGGFLQTWMKFLGETEERSQRSEEGRGPKLLAVQTKRGEAGGRRLTEKEGSWSRGDLPGNF